MSEHLEGVEISEIDIFITNDGSMEWHEVGRKGVTNIEAFTKPGMHADIPYVRVWAGEHPIAEFCQHQILGLHFKVPKP